MAYCVNCGVEVTSDMEFCPNCGHSVSSSPAIQSAEATHVSAGASAPVAFGGVKSQVAADNAKKPVGSRDRTSEFDPEDISDNLICGILPYFLDLLGIVIVLFAGKNSKYAIFQMKQYLKIDVVSIFFLLTVGAVSIAIAIAFGLLVLLRVPLMALARPFVTIYIAIALLCAVFFVTMFVVRFICCLLYTSRCV